MDYIEYGKVCVNAMDGDPFRLGMRIFPGAGTGDCTEVCR